MTARSENTSSWKGLKFLNSSDKKISGVCSDVCYTVVGSIGGQNDPKSMLTASNGGETTCSVPEKKPLSTQIPDRVSKPLPSAQPD